jgi:hypothetical protein
MIMLLYRYFHFEYYCEVRVGLEYRCLLLLRGGVFVFVCACASAAGVHWLLATTCRSPTYILDSILVVHYSSCL